MAKKEKRLHKGNRQSTLYYKVNGQRIQWLGHTMINKKPMVLGWH